MRREHVVPGPPSGAPWDSPLADAPLAFLDLEMTGLDVEKDRIVEICVERWKGGVLEGSLASLVRPPERAGGNARIHGLDEKALEGAPSFDTLADDALRLLDGAVIVAHAAQWDVGFLRAEMKRLAKPFEVKHWLDTLTLSRRAFGLESHSLGALCEHFGIDPGTHHRAADDVRALRAIFAKCVESLGPKSPRDLWHVRVTERHPRPAIVEACTKAKASGKPVKIKYRPAHKPAEEFQFVVLEVREGDVPQVHGYEMPSHSRRMLRTERILQVEEIEL